MPFGLSTPGGQPVPLLVELRFPRGGSLLMSDRWVTVVLLFLIRATSKCLGPRVPGISAFSARRNPLAGARHILRTRSLRRDETSPRKSGRPPQPSGIGTASGRYRPRLRGLSSARAPGHLGPSGPGPGNSGRPGRGTGVRRARASAEREHVRRATDRATAAGGLGHGAAGLRGPWPPLLGFLGKTRKQLSQRAGRSGSIGL